MRRTMTSFFTGFAEGWSLAKPYFQSEEKWAARGLFLAVLVLNLIIVGMNVIGSYWNQFFFNAMQGFDAATATKLLWEPIVRIKGAGIPMIGLVELVVVYVVIAVYAFYLNQMLQIRWRRWLTTHYVETWLRDRAYYYISLRRDASGVIDNPDQRIADDLNSFTSDSLSLVQDFIANVVTLLSFTSVLFTVGGSITLLGIKIPGYMLWVALLYSIVGTVLTHLIGRKLVNLSFSQQRLEANFRFGLIRIRENTEGIALSHGESEETTALGQNFTFVWENFWAIMRRTKALNFFTISFSTIATYFPTVVTLPNYMARQMTLGQVTQIGQVFPQVQGALSWFVGAYQSLVSWRATVSRLHGFREAMNAAHIAAAAGPSLTATGSALALRGLTLTLPDGRKLLDQAELTLPPGEPVTISGPSGAGKSTLFRAIAGIWPHGNGNINRPQGKLLFLPQKPYFPLGSLKRSLAYPAAEDTVSNEAAAEALAAVGLGGLIPQLAETANWALQLSGGEQQRLALARALVAKPDWLFLDEAVSALDGATAKEMYDTLRARLSGCTIIAISHHETSSRHIRVRDGRLTEAA